MEKLIKMIKTFIALLLICLRVSAQEKVTTTDHFSIDGKVKSSIEVTIQEILSMPSEYIDSFVIKNHLMQKKYTMTNVEGVPLKNILSKAALASDDPKQFSQYYFVFIASDNYKVVYSWNEIFNSSTGDHMFIIKSWDSNSTSGNNDVIAAICTSDQATGRRYVKALKEILVGRVD